MLRDGANLPKINRYKPWATQFSCLTPKPYNTASVVNSHQKSCKLP